MKQGNNGRSVTLPPRRDLRPMAPEHLCFPYAEERPETFGTGHLHWSITGFHHWGPDGQMMDSIVIDVEAPDELAATARAMEIVERPLYRTNSVRESCSLDKDAVERAQKG